jgi:anti-sigma regulatory factor (Ser/Thr protein kinase)
VEHRSTAAVERAPLPRTTAPAKYRLTREWRVAALRDLRSMRHDLRDELLDPALRHLTADDVVLVASELATNALEHGGGTAVVRLLVDGPGCLLDVADHDLASTPRVAGVRAPGAGGFGLVLTGRLSTGAGWSVAARTKHVWAEFRPAASAAEDGSARVLREIADRVDVDHAIGILRAGHPDRDGSGAWVALRTQSRAHGRTLAEEARAVVAGLAG